MNWWRAHHGIAHDPKLALIAKRAKAKRCEVLAVWISLLDYASQQQERGSIKGLDLEEISFQTDIPAGMVGRIIGQFCEKQMVDEDNKIAAWNKRQYGDPSTERVKRFRENKRLNAKCNGVKRDETNETRDETPVTVETPRTEQNRTEQKQTTAATQQLPPPKAVMIEFPKSSEFIKRKFPATDDAMVRSIVDRAVQEVIGAGEQPELVTDEVLVAALMECTTKRQYSAALYRETVGTWMRNMASME